MQWHVVLVRLILAVILGGIIGKDREKAQRPAGFRTHILVCLGSAVAMLTGEYLLNQYSHISSLDPTRIGAQVLSGIGFLGTGTIIMQKGSVMGLTTAASLWVVACLGLAVGAGIYTVAIFSAGLICFTLMVLRRFERNKKASINNSIIIYTKSMSRGVEKIPQILEKYGIEIKGIERIENEDKIIILYKTTNDQATPREEIIHSVMTSEEIYGIEFTKPSIDG